jgi:CheY-like chemotaxis protein
MHRILYAEDDPDDFRLLHDALLLADASLQIARANDGEEALRILQSAEDHMLPCLIILDINMPKIDGRQAILLIKADERLQHIPIVTFTTSTNPLDKLLCQKLQVDCFSKPGNINEIEAMAERLLDYCKTV